MSARAGCALLLVAELVLALALPAGAADDEPPPFWLGPDASDQPEKPIVAPPPRKAKKKKKKAPPPPRAEPDEQEPAVAPKRQKQRKRTAEDEAEAVLREIGVRPQRKKHAQAELPARDVRDVIMAPPPDPIARQKPEPAPPAARPTADPSLRPLARPEPAAAPLPPIKQPEKPPEPAPLAREIAAPPPPEPPLTPAAELRPPVVAPGPQDEAAAGSERPPELAIRRSAGTEVTASAFAGLWSSSSAVGGRRFDPAFGARVAAQLFGNWSAELYAARASASGGNPYAATATTRTLFGARGGYWVYETQGGLLAVQAAGGLAVALSSTSYSLRDVGQDPQAASGGSSFKLAPEAGASLRLRPLRFLELRLDASALYRDARLELLPSLGAGAWVAF